MDLKFFFNPVDTNLFADIKSQQTVFKNIYRLGKSFPDFSKADIALIGLTENRGSDNNHETSKAADKIRNKLFRLKKGENTYKILDLGDLKNGKSLEDTLLRIKEVCELLIDHDVLPILFGGTHDLDYGQYMSYESMDKLVSILNVDAFLDMGNDEWKDPSHSHIQKILTHEPNYLFNFSQLAHQTYLIDPESVNILEQLYFDAYRVGKLRQNITEMEPVIRDADMLSFDMTSIKSSDAPGNPNAQAFGLTGEEACQICWYAGMNEKLTSAGFYEYNPDLDDGNYKTASIAATMIWYFIEGFYNRKDHFSYRSNYYLKYVVSMPGDPDAIVFYKSKLSEKWWLEVPQPDSKKVFDRNTIVPCSYSDYEKAMEGEVPERWISTQARFI